MWGDVANYAWGCVQFVRMFVRPTVWDAVMAHGRESVLAWLPYLSLENVLKSGAAVDAVGFDGTTPLELAIGLGKVDAVRKLAAAGADVNRKDAKGRAPLWLAVLDNPADDTRKMRQREMVEILVGKGARAEDGYLEAAVMVAKNARLIPLLADAGAKVSRLAFNAAIREGDSAMLCETIAAMDDVNALDKDGWAPVHILALYGRVDGLHELMRRGGRLDRRGWDGTTPLHVAVLEGRLEMARALLLWGAEVNAREIDPHGIGLSPLDIAVQKFKLDELPGRRPSGDANMLALLLAAGADRKQPSLMGITPEMIVDIDALVPPHALSRAKMDMATARMEFFRKLRAPSPAPRMG